MEKAYITAKTQLVHFKLDYCCWFAPLRVGLMITGYFNIVADVVCMIGIANEGFSPTITRVQETLMEDFVNKPIPLLAYATELGFTVVLLCAVYRRDLVLLRVFLYYTIMAVIMSFLVYSIVFVAMPAQIQVAIVLSTLFQIYVILLVRSGIVEFKLEDKNYELPTLTMSSLVNKKQVTPSAAGSKNGAPQEILITELPKRQEVNVTIVSQDGKIKEEAKDTEVKKKPEVKNDTELKKVAEVKIEPEPKKNKDDKKKKDEKKTKDEHKIKDENKKKDDKSNKDVEKEGKTSSKDVKEAWLQTVNEHPKE